MPPRTNMDGASTSTEEQSDINPILVLPTASDKSPDKLKTEAANPYLQFLKERKSQSPGIPLDIKKVQEEWRKMSEDQRKVFVERYEMEKIMLGSDYRKNRKRKPKKTKSNNLSKKGKIPKQKNTLSGESVSRAEKAANSEPKNDNSIFKLLLKLEELDTEIEGMLLKNDAVKDELCLADTALAVKKQILDIKSDSHDSYKIKYNIIVKKHSSCYKD